MHLFLPSDLLKIQTIAIWRLLDVGGKVRWLRWLEQSVNLTTCTLEEKMRKSSTRRLKTIGQARSPSIDVNRTGTAFTEIVTWTCINFSTDQAVQYHVPCIVVVWAWGVLHGNSNSHPCDVKFHRPQGHWIGTYSEQKLKIKIIKITEKAFIEARKQRNLRRR